ncbi:MAG TPA: hypothetical protein VII19_08900 [Acidimicrobiales bacterium]
MGEPRQPKRSREELHALLIDAGRSILREEGFGTTSGNLTFKKVYERVERDAGVRLTNASVIRRVWENQAEFQADVLVAIAQDEDRPEIERTIAALSAVFDGLDFSTVESRARAMHEVCRIGAAANGEALLDSPSWSLWINVWAMATAGNSPAQQQRIRSVLREGYNSVNKLWEETYGVLAALLGLRVRRPLTIRQFTVAVGALSEGCSMRSRIEGQMEAVFRPTGPDGADQEWTVFAIGLVALVQEFFEPDPDHVWDPAPTGA